MFPEKIKKTQLSRHKYQVEIKDLLKDIKKKIPEGTNLNRKELVFNNLGTLDNLQKEFTRIFNEDAIQQEAELEAILDNSEKIISEIDKKLFKWSPDASSRIPFDIRREIRFIQSQIRSIQKRMEEGKKFTEKLRRGEDVDDKRLKDLDSLLESEERVRKTQKVRVKLQQKNLDLLNEALKSLGKDEVLNREFHFLFEEFQRLSLEIKIPNTEIEKPITRTNNYDLEYILRKTNDKLIKLGGHLHEFYKKLKNLFPEARQNIENIWNQIRLTKDKIEEGTDLSNRLKQGEPIEDGQLKSFDSFLAKDKKVRENQILRAKAQQEILNRLKESSKKLLKVEGNSPRILDLFKELRKASYFISAFKNESQTPISVSNDGKLENILKEVEEALLQNQQKIQQISQAFFRDSRISQPVMEMLERQHQQIDLIREQVQKWEELSNRVRGGEIIEDHLLEEVNLPFEAPRRELWETKEILL